MNDANRLQPVADIAKHAERSAARHHGDVVREYQKQRNQLDELIRYKNEYVKKFEEAGKTGLSIVQMRDYQLFIARLSQAIAQQQQQVQHGQQRSNESQQQWAGKRNHSKKIDKVVENRTRAYNQQQERREQRESDDRVNEVDSPA